MILVNRCNCNTVCVSFADQIGYVCVSSCAEGHDVLNVVDVGQNLKHPCRRTAPLGTNRHYSHKPMFLMGFPQDPVSPFEDAQDKNLQVDYADLAWGTDFRGSQMFEQRVRPSSGLDWRAGRCEPVDWTLARRHREAL